MKERPNFIIVVADQLRADALQVFNPSSPVLTPNLDQLAANGVCLSEVFGQHSVCSPSRTSFLSGLYPHVAGHRTLHFLLQKDEPNFLRTFKENGYHVATAGLRGDAFGPGTAEVSLHEYGLLKEQAESDVWQIARGSEWNQDDPMARAYYRGLRTKETADADFDEQTIRAAEQWLRKPPSSPWVLFVPLFFPHPPFEVEQPWFSMYPRDSIALPRKASGPQPQFLGELIREQGWDQLREDQWREIKATYFGMVSRFDAHVGRLQAANGAREATYTSVFSDHGEFLGDHGAVEKWPSGVNECLLRIPLIISGPGLASGAKSSALVELLDVFPTLLELAGIAGDQQHIHYGRSFAGLLTEPQGEHRTEVFSEGGFTRDEVRRLHTAPFPYDLKSTLPRRVDTSAGKVVVLRNRQWSYVWRLYEPAELYDRSADPHELHNLAGRPEHAAVESLLRERLLRWMVETADVLPQKLAERHPPVNLPHLGDWSPDTGTDR